MSPPSSKQDQINVDDAFRDRRVISVSIDSCSHNLTRNNYMDKKEAVTSDTVMIKRTGIGKAGYKGTLITGDEKTDSAKISGPVKTHRIVINLDDKNRFTDEVTV